MKAQDYFIKVMWSFIITMGIAAIIIENTNVHYIVKGTVWTIPIFVMLTTYPLILFKINPEWEMKVR